jgi:hypothetical protein
MTDKVVLTNYSALQNKYGPGGLKKIQKAVAALIKADKAKGLSTQIVDLSDRAQMKKYKGSAVSSPKSERQNKDAVDAVQRSIRADYLVLLDGPDVVPHLALNNPTPKDKEKDVPSDLPYASEAPFTKRDPAAYAAVTRVVGRIPGITGAKDPEFVIGQLEASAGYKSGSRNKYLAHFVLSADQWQKSTSESANNIFDSKKLRISPPFTSPGTSKMLTPLCHFINCHGGVVDPNFYGQRGSSYPVSLTSDDVIKGARPDTVVAAECCYGAQLYDPAWANGKLPICNAYLGAGAIGYFGSTTIAYGPEQGNGAADLITQYFLINILAGASTGRACLQARQKFVEGQKMEDPVNLKTLAQFILLGDPSATPCLMETPHARAAAKVVDHGEARKTRRVALVAFGKAAADSSGFPGRRISGSSTALYRLVQKIAKQRGFKAPPEDIESFHIVGGEDYHSAMKARGIEQKVVVVTEQPKSQPRALKGVPLTRIFVAHAQEGRVIDVAEYIRR